MRAIGGRLAARVDQLNLRERLILFVAVMAVLVALFDLLVLDPARQRHQALTRQFDVQGQELQRLREQVGALAKGADSLRPLSNALAMVKDDIAKTEGLKAAQMNASAGVSLPQVLDRFLRQQPGLSLVRTATLGDNSAVIASGRAAPAPAKSDDGSAGDRHQPSGARHAVELIVAGSYHELTRYVRTLESELPELRWGGLWVDATRQPPEMRMRVFLWGQQP